MSLPGAALGLALLALATTAGMAAAAPTDGDADPVTAPFAVGTETPTVSMVMHDSGHDVVTTVPVGSYAHALVSVTGDKRTPTGNVELFLWFNGNCAGDPLSRGVRPLVQGQVDWDGSSSNVGATWSFRARYLGDPTYDDRLGPCKSITYAKIAASLKFEMHNAEHQAVSKVLFPDSVHAFAYAKGRIEGEYPNGTINVRGWTNNSCSGEYVVDTFSLTSMGVQHSNYQWEFPKPMTRSFKAFYAGNATYLPGTSACLVVVAPKRVPVLALTVHDGDHDAVSSVSEGSTLHLRAKVDGATGTPTGDVTLWAHPSGTCTSPVVIGTGTLDAGVLHKGALDYTAGSTGKVAFSFLYKGDTSYAPATSGCVVVTVTASTNPAPTPTPPTPNGPAPTKAPTATASPGGTTAPVALGATDTPLATGTPSGSSEPAASEEPAGSGPAVPATTAGPEDSGELGPNTDPGAGPTAPGTASPDGGVGWLLPLVLALVLGGGLFLIGTVVGRQRRQTSPASMGETR